MTRIFSKWAVVFLVLELCLGKCAADEPERLFYGKKTAALVEIRKSGPITKTNREGSPYLIREVLVEFVARLPDLAFPDKQQVITVSFPDPDVGFGAFDRMRFFPTTEGERVVLAFDGVRVPDTGVVLVGLGSRSPDAVWKSVLSFHQGARQAAHERAAVFAAQVRAHRRDLGPEFFQLMESFDRTLMDADDVCLAVAEYLLDRTISRDDRLAIVLELRPAGERRAATHQALVQSLVQLALEEKKAARPPKDMGNFLVALSMQFISGRKQSDLPDLAPLVREELIALAKDPGIVTDRTLLLPLLNWLEGKEIGKTPARLLAKDSTAAAAPSTDARISPSETPSTESKDIDWLRIVWAVAGSLALILFCLGLRARKRARSSSSDGRRP